MKPVTGKDKITIQPFFCKGKDCCAYESCPKDKAEFCNLIQELERLKKNGNIFQSNPDTILNPRYSNIVLFPQDDRPVEVKFPESIRNAKKLCFMSRTGINFLSFYSEEIKKVIENGCKCKFIVVNQNSSVIEHGSFNSDFDKKNIFASYGHLKELKRMGRDNVEIHVLNRFPPFGFEYYENGGKRIIIRPHFLTYFSQSDRPMFMLKESDYWYDFFYNEFNNLWKKSQAWGETKRWGTPKRIIIDGPPGAGKTTLLAGKSDRDDMGNREFIGSFEESGYTVFGGLINDSIQEMRKKSGNLNMQPADDWGMFFKFAVARAIKSYKEAKPDLISFYDRGIHFLEIFANLGGYEGDLPDEYYKFVNDPKNRFNDPVFIFQPIPGYTVSPRPGDASIRNYTFEQLQELYQKIVELYRDKYRYQVVEIEAPTDPNIINSTDEVQKYLNKRLEQIKSTLRI